MTKLDPALCRRLSAALAEQYAFAEKHGYGITAAAAHDAAEQLTAAAEMAERPALTADEVRAVVREAVMETQGEWRYHGHPVESAANAIAARVAEKLAGRVLLDIGPERAAIIDQALVYWDRDLTAPHAQIAEIREMLGGGP